MAGPPSSQATAPAALSALCLDDLSMRGVVKGGLAV